MANPICSVSNCNSTSKSRGLCQKHYKRFRKHGTTDITVTSIREAQPCSVDGCARFKVALGYCNRHYSKFKRFGDPTKGLQQPHAEPVRFLREVIMPHEGDACLPWPYATAGSKELPYGSISFENKNWRVNRLICLLKHGVPPKASYVAAHNCGFSLCCNPMHIRWATLSENQDDRVSHGTSNRGGRNRLPNRGGAKLTDNDVREIRELLGKLKQSEIARLYGVSVTNINSIKLKKSWEWLE